jgi:hypothetical protein
MSTDTKVMSVRVPADLAQAVEDYATAHGMTRTEVLYRAVAMLVSERRISRQVSRPPVYTPPHR